MRSLLLLLFILFSSSVFAQDTVVYSKKGEIVDFKSSEIENYIITNSFDGKFDSISKKYNSNGQLLAEKTFNWNSKKEHRVYEGMHKFYYESGKPFYTEFYKEGKLNGNLVAFHENGQIRRRDRFKNGKLLVGQVWDENGKELPHFPHFRKAEFPGGKEALISYLRENIRLPEYIKKGETHKVFVKFTLDTEGKVASYQILESPEDKFYILETLRVLDAMPAWKPTELFGKKVKTYYTLPIVFAKS